MRSTASKIVHDLIASPAPTTRRGWLQQAAGLALATTCGLCGRLAQAKSLDIGKPAPPPPSVIYLAYKFYPHKTDTETPVYMLFLSAV